MDIGIKIGITALKSGGLPVFFSSLAAWWKGGVVDTDKLIDSKNTGDTRAVQQGESFVADTGGVYADGVHNGDLATPEMFHRMQFKPNTATTTLKAIIGLSSDGAGIRYDIFREGSVLKVGVPETASTVRRYAFDFLADEYYDIIIELNGIGGIPILYYKVIDGFYDSNQTLFNLSEYTELVGIADNTTSNAALNIIALYCFSSSLGNPSYTSSLDKIGCYANMDSSRNLRALYSGCAIVGSDVKDLVSDADMAITGTVSTMTTDDNYFHNYNNINGYTDNPSYVPAKIGTNGLSTGLNVDGGALNYSGKVPLNGVVTGTITDGHLNSANSVTFPACPEIWLPVKEMQSITGVYRYMDASQSSLPLTYADIAGNFETGTEANMSYWDVATAGEKKNGRLYNKQI